jgi:16S rRNA processing protein RimM
MTEVSEFITVAKIGKPHGVRGEMRVWVSDPTSEALFIAEEVFVEQPRGRRPKPYTLRQCRDGSKSLLVTLEGINSREDAEILKGKLLQVRSEVLPELEDPDEFYYFQLLGLDVVLADGSAVGQLKHVMETGSHDNLVIIENDGHEVLVPFVQAMVTVELDAGRIVIDPPEGLLEATRTERQHGNKDKS